MQATKAMLTCIKQAVKAMEESWDAQRDFELEVGKEFDEDLAAWIAGLAVIGAESVTLQNLQEFLDEAEHFDEDEDDEEADNA